MNNAESPKVAARGRSGRRTRTQRAIISATLELLGSVRYANLTIEAIAAKAGVGKATVYRRWPSKGAVVTEAITSTLRAEDPPATDAFPADLIAALETSIANYAGPRGRVLVAALAADLVDDPAVLSSFVEDFVQPRRRVVRSLIKRGICKGHIAPDRDPDLLMDMWAGAVIYRELMNHQPVPDDLATRMVDTVLRRP